MSPIKATIFKNAETYEPNDGWQRVALAESDQFSFERFEKPPTHLSPIHNHENEQVCVILKGELAIYTEDDKATLTKHDAVHLELYEEHRIKNTGSELAIVLDIYAPGHSFDYLDGTRVVRPFSTIVISILIGYFRRLSHPKHHSWEVTDIPPPLLLKRNPVKNHQKLGVDFRSAVPISND